MFRRRQAADETMRLDVPVFRRGPRRGWWWIVGTALCLAVAPLTAREGVIEAIRNATHRGPLLRKMVFQAAPRHCRHTTKIGCTCANLEQKSGIGRSYFLRLARECSHPGPGSTLMAETPVAGRIGLFGI